MITAKNYVAQAERGLSEYVKKLDLDRFHVDIGLILAQNALIKKAVHFAVPDGGAVFDDNFKGLSGVEVRLPFPIITIEYFVDGMKGRDADVHCPKRLVLAIEVDESFIKERVSHEAVSDKWIMVYSACTLPDGIWYPSVAAWAFPCKWDQKVSCKKIIGREEESHRPMMIGTPLFLPEFFRRAAAQYGEQVALENLTRDILMETAVVMELCEALTCSNVTHETIEKINPAVNARRIRDGKIPMYETRCLVINAGKSAVVDVGDGCGSHCSPRQYLRRGHIRKHPTAGNIWVNSCVVGDKANGVIEKNYMVQQ